MVVYTYRVKYTRRHITEIFYKYIKCSGNDDIYTSVVGGVVEKVEHSEDKT